jgi:RNA polymerase sigma-70 factor (ECF subfamily)
MRRTNHDSTRQAAATMTIATQTYDELNDTELVRRAQFDAVAFAPLYLRYRDRVLRYCLYRLGDVSEAEDAASAVFLKALGGLAGYRDGSSFAPWLFRIAHNEVVDCHKRRFRHPETALSFAADLADPLPSPEDAAVTSDALRRLRALLGTLPARERAVMELRLTDLTTTEIAAVLSVSEANVRTAQSRALSRLRDVMDTRSDSVQTNG